MGAVRDVEIEQIEEQVAGHLDEYPRCSICARPMVIGQRGRHFMCAPNSIVGRRCICKSKCTDTHVGDGGVCDSDCEPCATLAGRPYDEIEAWRKSRKSAEVEEAERSNDTPVQPDATLWDIA